MVSEPSLLTFPTDYPIKVVGRPSAEFRDRIQSIVEKHAAEISPERVSERLSSNGNFLSISYSIPAVSREQVIALATELKACELVVMVI